ncbi:MAG: hypothetical protein MUP47_11175 [Phycisphaerae bacterium]|nr:hypothetical protein [Phycisphaerae bacterium]
MRLLETHRRSVLSLVLLAILGTSVLAAWALVELSQAPVARAQDILGRIRRETLAHYWPSEASTRWYLIQDRNGRAVGYVVYMRRPSPDGFSGVVVHRLGDEHHGESWGLDPAATQGVYVATVGGRPLPDTQILLRDGQVTVIRPQPARTEQAVEPAPGNYIPEGLAHLVIAEVAKTSAKARFCLVVNAESIAGSQLRFTPVTMSPQGTGRVRVRTDFLEGVSEEVYHLDAKGEVFRIDDQTTGATMRLIDLHSLARDFPEVLDVQRSLEEGFREPADELDAKEQTPPPSPDSLEAALR